MTAITDTYCATHEMSYPADMDCPKCASGAPPADAAAIEKTPIVLDAELANLGKVITEMGIMPAPSDDDGFGLRRIPLDRITRSPWEVRTSVGLEDDSIRSLALDIFARGLDSPIIVRPSKEFDGWFERASGQRRHRAVQLLWDTGKWRSDWPRDQSIDAIVRPMTDKQIVETGLGENFQRANVSILDQIAGYQRIIDDRTIKQDELATIIGRSKSWLSNMLRLTHLPDSILNLVDQQRIAVSVARELVVLVRSRGSDCVHDEVLERLPFRLTQKYGERAYLRSEVMDTLDDHLRNLMRERKWFLFYPENGTALQEFFDDPDHAPWIHAIPNPLPSAGASKWTCLGEAFELFEEELIRQREAERETEDSPPQEHKPPTLTPAHCPMCGMNTIWRWMANEGSTKKLAYCPMCDAVICELDGDANMDVCSGLATLKYKDPSLNNPLWVCLSCFTGEVSPKCAVCKGVKDLDVERDADGLASVTDDGSPATPILCANCLPLHRRLTGIQTDESPVPDATEPDGGNSSIPRPTSCPDPLLEHSTSTTEMTASCAHCGGDKRTLRRDRTIDVHWLCAECLDAIASGLTHCRVVHYNDYPRSYRDTSCTDKEQIAVSRGLLALGYRAIGYVANEVGYIARAVTRPRPERRACPDCVRRHWTTIESYLLEQQEHKSAAKATRAEVAA